MKIVVRFRSLLNHGRALSLLIVLATLLAAANSGQAQNLIAVRFSGDGNYATVANGAGLDGVLTGDIPLTVPGTPVAAYLYWSGYDTDTPTTGGDNNVDFAVDGGTPITNIYQDAINNSRDFTTYGPELWFGSLYRFVYMAEVTPYILTGSHTYTISNFAMTGTGARQDGAGLVVVYENPAEPFSRVIIQDGLSIFFPTSNPPQTFRHSDTACLDFPVDTTGRTLNYSLFVGGLVEETPPNPPRTNALWSYTGTGTSLSSELPPRNIIDVVNPASPAAGSQTPITGANAISGVNYPPDQNSYQSSTPTFGNNVPPDVFDGDQWDTYTSTLSIPAGDTFACFQVQTFQYVTAALDPRKGSSGNWMALIGRIPLPATPTQPPNNPPANQTPVPTIPGNSAQTAVDPIVSKVPNPQNVVPGDPVTWTVTITNPSGAAMTSLHVTDPLDAGFFASVVSATSASSAVTATISGLSVIYDIPQILPGETLTLTLVARTRSDLAAGTVGTNFVIVERPGRPRYQSAPVSLSMIRRLPATGYPPH